MRRAAVLVAAACCAGCGAQSPPPRAGSATPAPSAQTAPALRFAYLQSRGEDIRIVQERSGRVKVRAAATRGRVLLAFDVSSSGRLAYVEAIGNTGGHRIRVREPGARRARTLLAGGPSAFAAVRWAPDGERLAITRREGGGHTLTVLPRQRPRARGVDIDSIPAWSPDGRAIAFVARGEVRVLDVETGSVRRLDIREARDPAWHPDGRRLAFVTDRGIEVAAIDGSGRRRLTTAPRSRFENVPDNHPVWTRDGDGIVFARDGRIHWISAAGGEPQVLSEGPIATGAPDLG